jgi:hypothetical protein
LIADELVQTDAIGAWLTRAKPLYDLEVVSLEIALSRPRMVYLRADLDDLQRFLTPDLFLVALDLDYLVDQQNNDTAFQSCPLDTLEQAEVFEDTFTAAHHRLAQLSYVADPINDLRQNQCQECWRCAAYIFLLSVVRKSLGPSFLDGACDRLSQLLEHLNVNLGGDMFPDRVRLWILVMGYWGSSQQDSHRQLWYVDQLGRLSVSMGLKTSAELKNQLARYPYRKAILDDKVEQLWTSIRPKPDFPPPAISALRHGPPDHSLGDPPG